MIFGIYLITAKETFAFAASFPSDPSPNSITRCGNTTSWPTISFSTWADASGGKLYWRQLPNNPGVGYASTGQTIAASFGTASFTPPAATQGGYTYEFSIWDPGDNGPVATKTVTFNKSATRVSSNNFTVDNITPNIGDSINFTGVLECQKLDNSWVPLNNQTVAVKNSSTGAQFNTATSNINGGFSINYTIPSGSVDIPAVPVYNGDLFFHSLSSPPTVNVYPPISCPPGTTYQSLPMGSSWKVEGCGNNLVGSNNPSNLPARIYLSITNKSGSSSSINYYKERWQCYSKQTASTGHSTCSDIFQPQGVIRALVSCSPIPAKTRVSINPDSCAFNSNTAFEQALYTDERSPCGSSQVDIWFNNDTVGPYWGFASSPRSELQGHCGKSNLKAENVRVSPTAPSPGSPLSFSANIANRGIAGTEGGAINSRFNLDLNNNGSIEATCVTSIGIQLNQGDIQPQVWNSSSGGCTVQNAVLGNHKIEFCVDDGNGITEFDSSTNCTSTTFTVSTSPPGAFTITTGTPSCSGLTPNITLYWSDSANVNPTGSSTADRYLIFRSTSQTGTYTQIPNSPQLNPSTLTILDNDNNLVNNTNYWYRVQAINQAGSLYATEPQTSSNIESFQVTTLNCNNPSVDLTIISPSSSNPKAVTLPPGQTFTLSWNTTNTPTFCSVSGAWPSPSTQRSGINGSSENLTIPTTTTPGPYSYNIQCTKNPGDTQSNISTVSVTVANLPTVDLLANNDPDDNVTISPGPAQANLTWTITNTVTSCIPTSSSSDSSWNGRTISASSSSPIQTQLLTVFPTPYVYTLTCTNSNFPSSIAGRSASDSVNITISDTGGGGGATSAWIQTTGGSVHSNTDINTPGGP